MNLPPSSIAQLIHSKRLPARDSFIEKGTKTIENDDWVVKLKPILNTNKQIRVHKMFGTIAYLVGSDKRFAQLYKNRLFLRLSDSNLAENPNIKDYHPNSNKGVLVGLYSPNSLTLETPMETVIHYLEQSIDISHQLSVKPPKPQRLKDNLNLTVSIERMLKSVNIRTPKDLEATGSVAAFVKLHQRYPIKDELILKLEGAIQSIHWNVLPSDLRTKLLNEIRYTGKIMK